MKSARVKQTFRPPAEKSVSEYRDDFTYSSATEAYLPN